ncbi:MAG TPA: c-type cytochrome [Bryobacteraceae bacterium]|nr:c-type cytochrome [Bryobacteraceae bacterium]
MWKLGITLAATLCAVSLWPAEEPAAARGRELFDKRCGGCHALDNAKVGPALRGVFGRAAAGDPVYPYSDALRKAKFVWDEPTLERWLTDPDALVPDNDMGFRVSQADERLAIIAWLKQLSAGQGQH